jgi:hypothetical protein
MLLWLCMTCNTKITISLVQYILNDEFHRDGRLGARLAISMMFHETRNNCLGVSVNPCWFTNSVTTAFTSNSWIRPLKTKAITSLHHSNARIISINLNNQTAISRKAGRTAKTAPYPCRKPSPSRPKRKC